MVTKIWLMTFLQLIFLGHLSFGAGSEEDTKKAFLAANSRLVEELSQSLSDYTNARSEYQKSILDMDQSKIRKVSGILDLIENRDDAIAIASIYLKAMIGRSAFREKSESFRSSAFEYKELWIVLFFSGSSTLSPTSRGVSERLDIPYVILDRNTGKAMDIAY